MKFRKLILIVFFHIILNGIEAYCSDIYIYSNGSDTTDRLYFTVTKSNKNEFTLFRIRDLDSLGFEKKNSNIILILKGDSEIARIIVPSSEEIKNFQIAEIKKSASGFNIISSWGGGNWLWDVINHFEFRGNDCYLVRTSITQYGPNKVPRKIHKVSKPAIRAAEFTFEKYLD